MTRGVIGPEIERGIRDRSEELRSLAAHPNRWIRTRVGADLWIDGLTAFQRVSPATFETHLRTFIGRDVGGTEIDSDDLPNLLAAWERHARSEGPSPASFWANLAIGMAIAGAAGGLPNIQDGAATVVNDTLLTLLSPFYRSLRFAAYNRGFVFRVSERPPRASFVPEVGFFAVAPPYVVRSLAPSRLQQYSIGHELVHLTFFCDVYRVPIGSVQTTAALLLNAEEVALSADLRFVTELASWGVPLHHVTEYDKTQISGRAGASRPDTPFARVRAKPAIAARYASGLKSRALGFADESAIGRLSAARLPPDLADWVSDATLRRHATWHANKARMIHRGAYREIAELWPPDGRTQTNARRFLRESLLDEPVPDVPRSDALARRMALLRFSLALLHIRLGELRANDDEGRSHGIGPSPDLEDLAVAIAIEGADMPGPAGFSPGLVRKSAARVRALRRAAFALVERDGRGDRDALRTALVDPGSPAPRSA
jgi:hypothetical protein